MEALLTPHSLQEGHRSTTALLRMRILGLDVGDRRIGVALSDSLGMTAQRLTLVTRQRLAADIEAIATLVRQHAVERIVIGLPLTLRGEQGPQAQKVLAFVEALRTQITVPLELVDERLTTLQGERALRETGASHQQRKQVIDQVAAQLILQQFLDRHYQRSPDANERDA